MPPKDKRGLNPEDQDLWKKVAGDVDRLKTKNQLRQEAASATKAPASASANPEKSRKTPVKQGITALSKKQPSPAPVDLGADRARNVDRRTWERLRRGKISIDATLDLHGMRQDAAHDALNQFLERSLARGKRCLLIVTGKGARQGVEEGWRGTGVLKEAIPKWLHEPSNRDKIVAIQPAQPKDGGDGALYVFLKRQRDKA